MPRSAEGTRLVQDTNPGAPGSVQAGLTVVGDRVFYFAFEPGTGRELWVSDGTPEGTRLVRDINPGGAAWPEPFAEIDGLVQIQDGAAAGLKPGDFCEVRIMGSDEHDLFGLVGDDED